MRFTVQSSNTASSNTATSGFSLDNIKIRGTENTPPSLCVSTPRTPVNVIVNPLPMPSASNVNLCGPGTATLNAVKLSGVTENVLQWYNAAVAGTLLQTGTSYTTPVLAAGTQCVVDRSD